VMAKAAVKASATGSGPIKCGIIMPIAGMPGYEPTHWADVLNIISRGIDKAGLVPETVWGFGAADIIQERIVRNLYEHPIAVCDVSGLNPNVMLELGIRLAFGKPTIIVTDEEQKVPFDINIIEYVPYSRDLHILRIEQFIDNLATKLLDTLSVVDGGDYRPFIKTFGPIELGTPGTDAIPLQDAVLAQLEQLTATVRRLENQGDGGSSFGKTWSASMLADHVLTTVDPGDQEMTMVYPVKESAAENARIAVAPIRNVRSAIVGKGTNGLALIVRFRGSPSAIELARGRVAAAIQMIED
jgi:hypothetical protein